MPPSSKIAPAIYKNIRNVKKIHNKYKRNQLQKTLYVLCFFIIITLHSITKIKIEKLTQMRKAIKIGDG